MNRVSICILLLLTAFSNAYSKSGEKCINIFYDRGPETLSEGRENAKMLQNLMGHFPHIIQVVSSVENYQKGRIEECSSAIYLGTRYDNPLPKTFLDDVSVTKVRFGWTGYNLSQLGDDRIQNTFGVKYLGQSVLDTQHLDAKKRPSFYRHITYKGQEFEKYGETNSQTGALDSAHEMALLTLKTATILATAKNKVTHKETPYAVRKSNKWYFTDNPFSYTQYGDRYLIFSDVLFDILDEKPRSQKKHALIRFEDIHAKQPVWALNKLLELASKEKIPFALSLIPVFRDPYYALVPNNEKPYLEMDQVPAFRDFIAKSKNLNVTFLYHGVTHQSDLYKNPSGTSAVDCEFWDCVKNRPLANEEPLAIVSRLEKGYRILTDLSATPSAWVTPHYAASEMANQVFSQIFDWSVGQLSYYSSEVSQSHKLPAELSFDASGMDGEGKRADYFSDLRINDPGNIFLSGQFFPYEIFGDVRGMRIVPESIGYIQPQASELDETATTVESLLVNIKRMSVIRDGWASMFIHPSLLQTVQDGGIAVTQGDTTKLEKLIRETKKLGFEFVDLQDWMTLQSAEKVEDATEIEE